MGKTLKKIGKNEVLFIVLSLMNIYIIPYILFKVGGDKQIWYDAEYEFNVHLKSVFSLWLCGIGGLVQILVTAFCEAFKKEKNDTLMWAALALAVPAFLAAFFDMLGDLTYAAVTAVSLFYMVPVISAAGVWLGRRVSGKYKGEKQFYAADIAYIVLYLAAAAVGFIIRGHSSMSMNEYAFTAIIIPVCVLSVIYSAFSDFGYLTDKLAKAAAVNLLLYTSCGLEYFFVNYIWKYTDVGNNSPYSVSPLVIVEFSALSAVLAVTASVMGVITGYFFRIMKKGGDEAIEKLPFGVRLKRRLVGVLVIVFFLNAMYFFIERRYYFYIKNANVWDETDVDINDICMLRVGDEDNIYREKHFTVTKDKAAINKIMETLKAEKGVKNVDPYRMEYCEPFYVYGYDKNFRQLFEIEMYSYACGRYIVSAGLGYNIGRCSDTVFADRAYDKCTAILIPSQYYGKKPTKGNIIFDIAEEAGMSKDEKLELIDNYTEKTNITESNDKYIKKSNADERETMALWERKAFAIMLCERLVSDKDADVRKAAARRLGKNDFSADKLHDTAYWLLRDLADDKDAGVRAEAYTSLSNFGDMDVVARLYGAVNSERDEKARFFAILGWGNAVKILDKEIDVYTELVRAELDVKYKSDTDRLALKCVLVRLGSEEYKNEAENLLKNIEDADIKNAAEKILIG